MSASKAVVKTVKARIETLELFVKLETPKVRTVGEENKINDAKRDLEELKRWLNTNEWGKP